MLSFNQFINEYNRSDKTNVLNRSKQLNIGIEIELEYIGEDSKPLDNVDENLSDLSNVFNYTFTRFVDKYSDMIKIVSDSTLINGIEIVSTVFGDLEEAKTYCYDFFQEYNNQELFKFEQTTGIHINISLKSNESINYLKLFLFLNDTNGDKAGYIYKDFEDRFKNKWTRPVKSAILTKIKNSAPPLSKNEILDDNYIKIINDMIKNNFFKNKLAKKSYSIVVKDNYFEFRHLGGLNISLEKILAKMEYFSYLSTLAFDKEYKRKEYLKKLYIFVDTIL